MLPHACMPAVDPTTDTHLQQLQQVFLCENQGSRQQAGSKPRLQLSLGQALVLPCDVLAGNNQRQAALGLLGCPDQLKWLL